VGQAEIVGGNGDSATASGPPRFRRHDIGGDIGGLEVAESIDPNDRMYCIPVMRQAAAVLFMRPGRVMSSDIP